jgi:3'(2'), 5'-bisphosphate nucleotidase
MNNEDLKKLLTLATKASLIAGKEINKIYQGTDFEIEQKEDETPLTLADRKSHEIIDNYLRKTDYPILSEEGKDIPYEERKKWEFFWLVDPLDGTKEFIKKNGEFTVNIALIQNGRPVMGVVYAPYVRELYFGCEKFGAYKLENATEECCDFSDLNELMKEGLNLPLTEKHSNFVVVASRSHLNDETKEYIDSLRRKHQNIEFISKGSSLKICMVAEGKANVYPRFAPTMEWDTAAGHAVAVSAGFKVTRKDEVTPLEYNKEELRNPWFIVKE